MADTERREPPTSTAVDRSQPAGSAHLQSTFPEGSAEQNLPAETRPSDINALLRLQRDPGKLDSVARRIKGLAGGSSLAHVLKLGELIFREVYDSQPALLHKGARQASLRRLAAHPDVPCKVTTLWRAVSVYEMSLRLPHLCGLEELGVSHLRAVIGLPVQVQEQLLMAAARERWTKRRLEREASLHRVDRRRGRQPLPQLIRWTRELERLVARSAAFRPEDLVVRSGSAAEARRVLAYCQNRCDEIAAEIEAPPSSRPGKNPPEPPLP